MVNAVRREGNGKTNGSGGREGEGEKILECGVFYVFKKILNSSPLFNSNLKWAIILSARASYRCC